MCKRDLHAIRASEGGRAAEVSTLYPLFARAGGSDEEAAEAELKEWAPRGWYAESQVVDSFVQHAVAKWRQQFTQGVRRKVHSLFMLRFTEALPAHLADELHNCCDPESLRSLDFSEARARLSSRREQLVREQEDTRQLLNKFHRVRARLGGASAPAFKRKPSKVR